MTARMDLDLVGGPFAVVESDPGVFTALVRRLGVRAVDVVELYDIEPWAVDHLRPLGLTGSKLEKLCDIVGITINSASSASSIPSSLC